MNHKLILSLGCLALAGQVLTASGQVVFSDDFNTGTDPSWTRWIPTGSPVPTFSFPSVPGNGLGYEIAAAPGSSSFFTTARGGSYVTGLNVSDFTVSADLVNWAGTDEMQMGVMGRVQAPVAGGAFPGCYALVYINRFSVRGSGTDQIRILRLGPNDITFLNDGLGNQGQFGVVAGGSSAPQPGGHYRLSLTATGNSLVGRIMDMSTGLYMTFNDGNGNLTDFIHATDSSALFSSGSAGVFTVPNTLTPGVDTTFDNFSVSIVPEPSAAALAGLGLAILTTLRRKPRSK